VRFKRKIAVILAFSLVSLIGRAAIPPQEVLETQSIKPVVIPKMIKPEDIALVIPMNLQPGTNDEDVIMARIADHSINNLIRGDYFRNTEFGKAAARVENAMKAEVSLGTSDESNGHPPIEHKINMQLQAFEQKAYVTYSGLVNLNLTYLAAQGLDVTMSQALTTTTTLVLNHSTRDAISRLNMMWAW
jgi:hypothetical protein